MFDICQIYITVLWKILKALTTHFLTAVIVSALYYALVQLSAVEEC